MWLLCIRVHYDRVYEGCIQLRCPRVEPFKPDTSRVFVSLVARQMMSNTVVATCDVISIQIYSAFRMLSA